MSDTSKIGVGFMHLDNPVLAEQVAAQEREREARVQQEQLAREQQREILRQQREGQIIQDTQAVYRGRELTTSEFVRVLYEGADTEDVVFFATLSKQKQWKQRTLRATEAVEAAEKIVFNEELNHYLGINASKSTKRSKATISKYLNVLVDIDLHGELTSGSSTDLFDLLLLALREKFSSSVPLWTVSVYTGRGLQLWWHIEPMAGNFSRVYDRLKEAMFCEVERVLQSNSNFSILELDSRVKKNSAGLGRLAGSYNIHAKGKRAIAYFEEGSKSGVSMDEFAQRLNIIIEPDVKKTRKTAKKTETTNIDLVSKNRSFTEQANKLIAIVEYMTQKNKEVGNKKGHRHNVLFVLYNTLKCLYDAEVAKEKVAEFNCKENFISPWGKVELESMFSGVDGQKCGRYFLSNDSIIELLGMTQEECELFNFFSLKAEKNEAYQRKLNKEKKDADMYALHTQGLSNREIAKRLSSNKDTVKRAIERVIKRQSASNPCNI